MTTHPLDAAREMDKVVDALAQAVTYLGRCNEADAALHLSDRVWYSPLTVIVENGRASAERVRSYLHEQVADTAIAGPPERKSPRERPDGL